MKNKTIGIVGGGQLGRMLALAGQKLGFKVNILDPTPGSPAGLVADKQVVGSFTDKEQVLKFAEGCDFITFEIESVNVEALEELALRGIPVNPTPEILKTIKDKFTQKIFLKSENIPVAEFALIGSEADCVKQGEAFDYPFMLKARFGAYDGRGNFRVNKKEDIPEAFNRLSKSGKLYAEKFVPFIKELSVVCARDKFNTVISFPVVETIHRKNICHIVRSPASVSREIQALAEELASKVLQAFSPVGVFAVEMFLTSDRKILVNEIAPRVHNSGHHTIEAFSMSQFEQHIRAVTGMPILEPETRSSASVMVNILGERNGEAFLQGIEEAKAIPGVKIHIYGKIDTKKERKMGHITATGETLKEAEDKALRAQKIISI